MLLLCFLALALQAAECGPADHECNAERYARLAEAATIPQHRADLLYGAHRAYTARFDETGEAEHLCAARRTFNQGIAVKGQTGGQRAAFAGLRAALTARERGSGVRCKKPGKEIITSTAGSAAPLRVEPSVPASIDIQSAVARPETVSPASAPLATRPAPPIRQPLPAVDPVTRRRFRAGLATLVPGVVLLGPVGGLLGLRGAVRADWDALQTTTKGRSPTPDEVNTGTALNRKFHGTAAAVVTLGAASAALLVTGTILLVTGRHSTRIAVGPWGARGLSGLAIQGVF